MEWQWTFDRNILETSKNEIMKTQEIEIGQLFIDPKLRDMRHINPVVVSRYRQSYRNGAPMPYIIVEDGPANRIVSGNHRATALLKEYNDDHVITVEVRNYANERGVLEDFLKENLTHGMPLDDFSKKKIVNALTEEGASAEDISKLFNLPVKRIEKFGEGSVMVTMGDHTEEMPSKRGFEPEKVLTEEQYKDHATKDRGFPVSQQVSQLMRWIVGDLIPYNEDNDTLLRSLRDEIDLYLKRNAKKKKVA